MISPIMDSMCYHGKKTDNMLWWEKKAADSMCYHRKKTDSMFYHGKKDR